ncbi:DUF4347 domain-containing protein [Mesorhizobium newzealandense]|uniref:DUF4347 domain-containing protein n=1 Tax=Mesorhizobium newzealandense TaxID=1300302 RepID=A0ABW4U3L6_9HYPH
MARASEILFVDPTVSDLQTVLGNVRPEVQAIVLDGRRPAAQQIAAALAGHAGLDAVHVIAHGAPGRVSFAAGVWSVETLDDDEVDLAGIGRALGADGDLVLWSCHVGAGTAGSRFVDALSRVAGAPVAAADNLVGSHALGGQWELAARLPRGLVRPPLTSVGMAGYAGVLFGNYVNIKFPASTAPNRYHIVVNIDGTRTIIGDFTVPKGTFAGSLSVSVSVSGSFTISGTSSGMSSPGSIGLFSQISGSESIDYDVTATPILGPVGTKVTCAPR